MGFGGATAAMIASLKNNNRRTKREPFSHLDRGSDVKTDGVKVESVSDEVLEEIRVKIKRQKAIERKQFFIFLCIAIGFILLVSYQISGLSGEDVNRFFRMFRR